MRQRKDVLYMDKKALLVVSFGTSFEETRRKTIDAIENELRQAFPERRFTARGPAE
jgi:sirohydrochlorin cobaltochelatase